MQAHDEAAVTAFFPVASGRRKMRNLLPHILPHHEEDIGLFLIRHGHGLDTVHAVEKDVVQDQELKIVPVVRQELILQMPHHLEQVEILPRVVVVHRGGQTAAVVIERIREMRDLSRAVDRDCGKLGILVPELFLREADILNQAASEELV